MRTQSQMLKDYEAGIDINISDDKYSYLYDADIDDVPEIEIKPISWEEFKSYTENERRYYLSELKRMFNVPQSEISLYFKNNKSSLSAWLSQNGPKKVFTDRQHIAHIKWDKEGWYAFIGKELPKEPIPQKEPSVKVKNDIYISGSGEMLVSILSAAINNGKNYEVIINEI